MTDLHGQLMAAHAADDRRALAHLYARAADTAPTADAAGFFLTNAYVYALDCGAPEAAEFHARLKAQGRDA